MSNYEILVMTPDGQKGGVPKPASLSANPGDQIIVKNRHRGKMPPQQLTIMFTSQNICSISTTNTQQIQLKMQGNSSVTVQMLENTKPGPVTNGIPTVSRAADPPPVVDDN